MDTGAVIALCVLAGIIFLVVLITLYQKKRIMEMLAYRYGRTPERDYDERDFTNISQLFKLFPVTGKESIDDITWNDLQMPLLYKQMNHSVSHVGDEYFYRHMRTQRYDGLDRLEKHIGYFNARPEERLRLQYAFYKINSESSAPRFASQSFPSRGLMRSGWGKPAGGSYFEHLKNPDSFPQISILPSAAVFVLAVLSILSNFFLNPDDGFGAMMLCVFMGSMFYFRFFIAKTAGFIRTLKTFSASVAAGGQIAKLDSADFDKELRELLPALKKLQRKSRIMQTLVNICFMQNRGAAFISIITIWFGLYGFVYNWVVRTIKNNTKEAMIFYDTIGYIELCIGQSSYRKTLLYYCPPQFTTDTHISFEELYHPLLQNPVTNTKSIDQRFIITGANASGKSTFAKTLAVNAISAQALNICCAKDFRLRPACVYTSMKLEDNIISGDSFYVAEIKRLKGFLDSLSENSYKMFFADEILKGTNTTERIAAASAVLKRFAESDCFFCLTTHDTELTGILRNFYTNYHFKEITTDTEIHYDYKLYDGVTPGSNAIALLRYTRYDPSIVDEAAGLERHYLNSKEWEILSPTGQ